MPDDTTVSIKGSCGTLKRGGSTRYGIAKLAAVSSYWNQWNGVSEIVASFLLRLCREFQLHPLDQFETAWASGEVPELQAYTALLAQLGEESAISELCQIDMEHRWKSTHSTVRRHLARDYLVHSNLTMRVSDAIELICWEYHVRNHWGDYPSFRVLLEEWSQYRPALDAAIQQTADSIVRPTVMISGTQTPQESFVLDGVLEVGRQNTNEPAPFARVMTPDGGRLIVAANTDASISRTQLAIRRDSKSSVLVKNTSRNRALAVIGQCILDAGESASCPMPARIHLREKLILSIEIAKR